MKGRGPPGSSAGRGPRIPSGRSAPRVVVCTPNHTPSGIHCPAVGCAGWKGGRAGMALVPATEAAMGLVGHPGSGRTCHCRTIPRWHQGGDAGKHSRTRGQVQIVLKHRRAGFRWRQRALRFSGERFRRRLRPSPVKTRLLAESFGADLGAAVEESKPQIHPGCQTAFSGSFPSRTGPSDLRASVFGRCRSTQLGPA